MKLILKIAWRNIVRHKGKSIVIGVILFIGSLLMTIGNGVIAGMNRGIERNIVNAFLGDIVIISDKQRSDNVLLEFMGTPIEPVNNYPAIKKVLVPLAQQGYVEKFLPIGKNMVMALSELSENPGFIYLIGTDIEAYQKMFPGSLTVVEGRMLQPKERGLIVPEWARSEYFLASNIWFISEGGTLVKENLTKEAKEDIASIRLSSSAVLLGMSDKNSTTDIRFMIKGIVKYRSLNTIFGHFTIADIESYRECLGYISATDKAVEIPQEEKKLLDMESNDLDSMFTDTSLIVSNERSVPRVVEKKPAGAVNVPQDVENGTYNMVLVKVKDGVSRTKAVKDLNVTLSNANLGVRAVPWHKAAGPIGSMTLIIKGALFVFVTILFFVAIIIIVNTLTMAALERTPELGMMRAIGAKKGFVGGMFLGETAVLSGVFGIAGILVGIIVINVIPLLHITTKNDMLQLVYGGDAFHPILQAPDILLTLVQLFFVTVLAALYPMHVAKNITPLDAIAKD